MNSRPLRFPESGVFPVPAPDRLSKIMPCMPGGIDEISNRTYVIACQAVFT